jgi:hypothetical protein
MWTFPAVAREQLVSLFTIYAAWFGECEISLRGAFRFETIDPAERPKVPSKMPDWGSRPTV